MSYETEPPFTGKYWDHHERGVYFCAECGTPLFTSKAKFDSGTGWPSFDQPLAENQVEEKIDFSNNMVRTEIVCAKCAAHLGHLFGDGPTKTGLRYCMNSSALDFQPK